MKIAISASAPELSSSIDPRFGRCPYFIFIDPATMDFEAVENPNISSPGGAGIQSAQFIASKEAKVLLTGSCGPNAFQTLQAAGVEVVVGITGSIQEAVQQYKSGQFQSISQANVSPHFGMGIGPGSGMGRGMGGGMGRGIGGDAGRGLGRGMGYGYSPPPPTPGMSPPDPFAPQASPEEEIKVLKQQAEYLRQQMEGISKKIKDLEKNKK